MRKKEKNDLRVQGANRNINSNGKTGTPPPSTQQEGRPPKAGHRARDEWATRANVVLAR